FPQAHRRRMRTTNPLERLHEELNRRTNVARIFPNEASLIRLISAIEISEDWVAGKRYLDMNAEIENENEPAKSSKKKIYRKDVA
ncbi:MAG: transposase, partial [Planctomycetota bacterium]